MMFAKNKRDELINLDKVVAIREEDDFFVLYDECWQSVYFEYSTAAAKKMAAERVKRMLFNSDYKWVRLGYTIRCDAIQSIRECGQGFAVLIGGEARIIVATEDERQKFLKSAIFDLENLKMLVQL